MNAHENTKDIDSEIRFFFQQSNKKVNKNINMSTRSSTTVGYPKYVSL